MKSYKIRFLLLIILFIATGCEQPKVQDVSNVLHPQQIIVSCDSITAISKYADKDTFVIFDLDLTLIRSYLVDKKGNVYNLGSAFTHSFFDFIFYKNAELILPKIYAAGVSPEKENEILLKLRELLTEAILDKDVEFWLALGPNLKVELVEPISPEYIAQLQELGIKFITFTARPWRDKEKTINDLHSVGIFMDKNTVYDKEIFKKPELNLTGYGFDQGVLFIIEGVDEKGLSVREKGPAILNFLHDISYKPKKVIFVDDRKRNLKSVESVFIEKRIPFVGLFYKGFKKTKSIVIDDDEVEAIAGYLGKNWWKLDIDTGAIAQQVVDQLSE